MSRLSIAAVGALLAALAPASSAHAKTYTLRATMNGAAEVPTADAGASARAKVVLDSTKGTVCWTFTKVRSVPGANGAHIHQGVKGEAGAVVVPFGATFRAKGCQRKVDKRLIRQIARNPGRYYVNIHNSQHPAGAVRGQLRR